MVHGVSGYLGPGGVEFEGIAVSPCGVGEGDSYIGLRWCNGDGHYGYPVAEAVGRDLPYQVDIDSDEQRIDVLEQIGIRPYCRLL